jgi:hypothetical protein
MMKSGKGNPKRFQERMTLLFVAPRRREAVEPYAVACRVAIRVATRSLSDEMVRRLGPGSTVRPQCRPKKHNNGS